MDRFVRTSSAAAWAAVFFLAAMFLTRNQELAPAPQFVVAGREVPGYVTSVEVIPSGGVLYYKTSLYPRDTLSDVIIGTTSGDEWGKLLKCGPVWYGPSRPDCETYLVSGRTWLWSTPRTLQHLPDKSVETEVGYAISVLNAATRGPYRFD